MVKISFPEKITQLFNHVIKKIRNALDPDYIIIAGSFGKGSWIYSGSELLSDFEFVFICNKPWSISIKNKLKSQLNEIFEVDISLKGFLINNVKKKIITNYSLKYPGYLTLDYFDTFKDPIVLYSKKKIIDFPFLENKQLPFWEAWRLLVNRLGHFLEISLNTVENKKVIYDYSWLKSFESAAEGYLLTNGLYHPNIKIRLNAFTKERIKNDSDLTKICKESFDVLLMAMQAREKHDISIFNSFDIEEHQKFFILSEWMLFVTKKMFVAENIKFIRGHQYISYLECKRLHNKYLLTKFNFISNVMLSNILLFFLNPSLLKQSFKFFNTRYSCRHIILLTIVMAFNEFVNEDFKYRNSKLILANIINKNHFNHLNGEDYIRKVIKYWKAFR